MQKFENRQIDKSKNSEIKKIQKQKNRKSRNIQKIQYNNICKQKILFLFM